MTKPTYVELDGGMVFRPPYLQDKTFLTAWLLRSDKRAQQALLDRAFNHPSGGAVDYRPIFSSLIFSFANIERISSLDPKDRGYGYTTEVDTCFWMLTGAYKHGALDHIAWFVPYIWVDSSLALVAGRDVYGYPKQIGWSKLPSSPSDRGPIWTDGLVIPRYDASAAVRRERIVTLERTGPDPLIPPLAWGAGGMISAVRELFERMAELDDVRFDLALLQHLLEGFFGGHVPMVFLKQYRDACSGDKAAYQAIVEANATVTDFEGAGLLPAGFAMTIHQYDSHRVADTLGLPEGPFAVDHGFWTRFSFSMDLGKEIWRAP